MANKSSKSPTGEDRAENTGHMRDQEVEQTDVTRNADAAKAGPTRSGKQENLKNRGYQEDQPGNPIRNNGSMREADETGTTGEPEASEQKMMKNNQTGPGLG